MFKSIMVYLNIPSPFFTFSISGPYARFLFQQCHFSFLMKYNIFWTILTCSTGLLTWGGDFTNLLFPFLMSYFCFQLIYTCSVGHVARGSLSRECQLGGVWSGSGTPPACEFVDCGQPPELLNGSFEMLSGRTTYAAEIRYTCGEDYNISGDQIRRWVALPGFATPCGEDYTVYNISGDQIRRQITLPGYGTPAGRTIQHFRGIRFAGK